MTTQPHAPLPASHPNPAAHVSQDGPERRSELSPGKRRPADDAFAREVDHVLLFHREDRPYTPGNYSELCACRHEFPKWRAHTVELIAAARARADEKRAKTHRDVTETMAAHAPYIGTNLTIQCLECVDGQGGGVYRSTEEWAAHLRIELARAGFRVVKR